MYTKVVLLSMIAAKINGLIDWSWWLILAPLLIQIAAGILFEIINWLETRC